MDIPDIDSVRAAAGRIAGHVHVTPVLRSAFMDALSGAEMFFKCENFQKTGSFKARGACNAVMGLPRERHGRGVATHSSGNHAQALSYAAGRLGIEATVVMPSDAPRSKQNAVAGYGGRIVPCEPLNRARVETLERVIAETGAEFIHPYNDSRVIAGQGTCALELLEQCAPLDAVVAPVGGGGLISGSCVTLSSLSSGTEIYAAEPEQADDAFQSLKTGHIVRMDRVRTVADGLKTSLEPLTWHFISRCVTGILTVSEQEIVGAMYRILERMKIVVEPSAATPLAAILGNPDKFAGKRVGVVLSGGNVDLDRLPAPSPAHASAG